MVLPFYKKVAPHFAKRQHQTANARGRGSARPRKRRREDGRAEPGGDSRRRRGCGDHAASVGPTFRRADRRPRPRGRRNAQARGQRAEHAPRGPARHLAPRRVQRRGVCSKARRRALRGGEERQRRAGGSKNRDAYGGAVFAYVPSGAPAPRGTRPRCDVASPGLIAYRGGEIGSSCAVVAPPGCVRSAAEGEAWWRRGELNPRPHKSHSSFYARVSHLGLALNAACERATFNASHHIDSSLSVGRSPITPVCCHRLVSLAGINRETSRN